MRYDRGTYKKIGETCLCLSLRKASRSITKLYDEILKPSTLRATQLTVLAAIAATEPATTSSLAEALVMDRTTLTRNLKPLKLQGLTRIITGDDRRTRLIALTPAGQRALDRALPLWEKAQKNMVEHLGQNRWNILLARLSDVISSVEKD